MLRALTFLSPLLLCGCMAVLGYEPTDAELEAIRRGEDPRAGEAEREAEREQQAEVREAEAREAAKGPPAPAEGQVVRWMDSMTLVIEADARREVVAVIDDKLDLEDRWAVDERMNNFTYGMWVRLRYPLTDDAGEVIYRDHEGRLLAEIE